MSNRTPPAANPPPDRNRIVLGILLMSSAMLVIPSIDAIAKSLTGIVSPGQVSWSRFVFQTLLLAPSAAIALLATRWSGAPASATAPANIGPIWAHAARGALISIATLLFFAGVQVMPIADTIAIFFVEPLLLTLLSALILKEHIGWRRIAAVLIGFCGALLVIQPKFHDAGLVVLYPLGAALAFSLYMILTRMLAADVNPLVMQCMAGVFGFLTMSVGLAIGTAMGVAALSFAWPSSTSWALLALLGVIATLTHILVVLALKYAPASVVAPFQYLEIISATMLGYVFFRDFPTPMTWLGITIIVGSGIYVIYREHQIARRQNAHPRAAAAPPPPPLVPVPAQRRA